MLFQFVDYEARTELRLKPGCLRGHDVSRVGNVHKLLHGNGIEREAKTHLATVYPALQFAQPADSSDEIDAFIAAKVVDAEDVAQDQVGGNRDVEDADRVLVVVGAFFRGERVPMPFQI